MLMIIIYRYISTHFVSSFFTDEPFCEAQRKDYSAGLRASTTLGSPGMSAGAFLRSPYATGGEPDIQMTIHPWDKCET